MARVFTASMMFAVGALADKIGDMDQGAEFTKCIALDDFHSKTLDDDITLHDRDANGCCAEGHVPGAKLYTAYQGSQIACGVEDDGTAGGYSSSSSNGVTTCDYGKCYVFKQGLACSDDTMQLLNGCCGATKSSRTFTDDCMSYDYTHSTATAGESATTEYCLTYDQNYGTKGNEGTTEADDDIADGKFLVENFNSYAACEGGSVSGGGKDASSGAVDVKAVFPALAMAGLSFISCFI